MAGMQGLGRVFDVVAAASGVNISLKNCSAISYVVTSSGTSSLALTASTLYSGGTTDSWTTALGFGQVGFWYQNTSHVGTAAWTKQTSVWSSNSIALAQTSGYVSVVTFYVSELADTFDYINATETGASQTVALLHDLTVQRTPANLAILGA